MDSTRSDEQRMVDFYLFDADHTGPFEDPQPEGTVEVQVHELRKIRAALGTVEMVELEKWLKRTWDAIDAKDDETETVTVGVKWLLDVNYAIAHLRKSLATARGDEIKLCGDPCTREAEHEGGCFAPITPPSDASKHPNDCHCKWCTATTSKDAADTAIRMQRVAEGHVSSLEAHLDAILQAVTDEGCPGCKMIRDIIDGTVDIFASASIGEATQRAMQGPEIPENEAGVPIMPDSVKRGIVAGVEVRLAIALREIIGESILGEITVPPKEWPEEYWNAVAASLVRRGEIHDRFTGARLPTEEEAMEWMQTPFGECEKLRLAAPVSEDAPEGPWWIHTAEDGWTLQNDECDPPKVCYFPATSESANSDNSFTVEMVELFRDALNRKPAEPTVEGSNG